MRLISFALVLLCANALLCAGAAAQDPERVKAEPNPEKRSRAALDAADANLKAARQAYADGDMKQTADQLNEFSHAVALAESSLNESGKNPSKSPKQFKHAEIKTGELLRKLDAFAHDMSYTDRPMTEKIRESLQEAHDRLLSAIMGKKK